MRAADQQAGRLALERGWMDAERVQAALRLCEVWGMSFADCALQASWLTSPQVAALRALGGDVSVGSSTAGLCDRLAEDILAPGRQLGDYVLERQLGEGAFGQVFLARHVTLGFKHAIKVVRFASVDQQRRFLREGETLARLNHAGVVRVHQCVVDPSGWGLLSMDAVEGTDLEGYLQAAGKLSVGAVLDIGAQIADALAHMHAAGVVHRDLKPANAILRADTQQVVLCDFGVAHDMQASRLTQSQQLLGSPAYMAPEQILGERDQIGPPTDVYGLGAVLYRLLSGAYPYEADSLPQLASMILNTEPERLRPKAPDAPRGLEDLLRRAMAKKPELRPTAAQMRVELQAIASGGGRGLSSRGLVAGSLCALVVALVLGAGWLVTRSGRAAQADLKQAQAFEAELERTWGLGLIDPSAAPDGASLTACVSRLQSSAAHLSGEDAAAVDALRRRLAARAWLLDPRRPALTNAESQGRVELTALALSGLQAGEQAEARSAFERLTRSDRKHPLSALLELELMAREDPLACLRRAAAMEGVPQRSLTRIAVEALRGAYAGALAKGARLAGERAEVIAECALSLGVPLELHREVKASALGSTLAAPDGVLALEALVAVARTDPAVTKVPDADVLVERVRESLPADALLKRLDVQALGDAIGARAPASLHEELLKYLRDRLLQPVNPRILLGAMRLGLPLGPRYTHQRIKRWATRPKLEQLRSEFPKSAAVRFLLLSLSMAGGLKADPSRALEAADAVLDAADADLGRHQRGELELVKALILSEAGSTVEEVRPHLERGRADIRTEFLRWESYRVEVHCLTNANRGAEVEEVLAAVIVRLEARLRETHPFVSGSFLRERVLVEALRMQADCLVPERFARAQRLLDHAVDVTRGVPDAAKELEQLRATRIEIHLRVGRAPEAMHLLPDDYWGWVSADLPAAACRLFLAMERLPEARRALEELEGRTSRDYRIDELREELHRAEQTRDALDEQE